VRNYFIVYKTICLDEASSTTRQLTKVKPFIEKKAREIFESLLFLPEGGDRQGEGGLRTKGYYKVNLADKPLITIVTVGVGQAQRTGANTVHIVIQQVVPPA
jgi:hypothetical protein